MDDSEGALDGDTRVSYALAWMNQIDGLDQGPPRFSRDDSVGTLHLHPDFPFMPRDVTRDEHGYLAFKHHESHVDFIPRVRGDDPVDVMRRVMDTGPPGAPG